MFEVAKYNKIAHCVRMSPGSTRQSQPPAARQAEIRRALAKSSSVSSADMARRLGVSEMTVRRDLEKLSHSAEAKRTHGGAVVAERTIFEFAYQERCRVHEAEKKLIAAAARRLIKAGQRIILDTGTTTLHFAGLLKDARDLTVITPSLAVASELQFASGVSVILLGGMIHRGSPDLTGPLTEHCLEVFSADWAFQGAEAVGDDGTIYNIDLQLAQVDRRMRAKADKCCLLVDSSKFGQTALVSNGTLEDFDVVITERGAPKASLKLARTMARDVILA